MAWSGSGHAADAAQQLPGGHINPFVPIPHLAMVGTFTEQLPCDAHLQWAMPTPFCSSTISADRGNMGLAEQHSKPGWLSKPGFLDFCRQVQIFINWTREI